ncbi:MAG: acyltransferase family protein [Chloroflexota bacterium]
MENENKPSVKRLYSLDALRGFDMFWIMGGEAIFTGLATLTGWPVLKWWSEQLDHVPWHGFVFYDMIFPLFLFIAGISFPFSLSKRIAENYSRSTIYRHIITRGLILVVLGIIYNNGIRFNLGELRYGSVLGRIGLAWMFAALIFMNTKLSWRIVWLSVILLGYWFALMLFPAHDLGSTDIYSMEGNLTSHIDRMLMPGRLYLKIHDPEGLFSTIPAIGTALLGMFTGEFMMSKYLSDKPLKKVLYLVTAAIVLMIIGKVWNLTFPINKNLWTSSFVCFVGGLSLLLFSIFYLIIDVWQYKKWAFFFVVIGVNPITIYLVGRIVNFRTATRFFFGGFMESLPETWTPFIEGVGVTAVAWTFLYILYKKKIFLKI